MIETHGDYDFTMILLHFTMILRVNPMVTWDVKWIKWGSTALPAQMLAGHRGRQRVEFRSADLVATLGSGMPRWGRELGMDQYLLIPFLGE